MPSTTPSAARRSLLSLGILGIALFVLVRMAHRPTAVSRADEDKPTVARNGMVVAVSPPGVDVGVAILKKGGNAVDAAVATALAMAVTYPSAGNLGGGGFMMVYPGKKYPDAEPVVFEYRETAPAAATPTMYGKADTWYTHRVVGVPGTVRGMALAHAKFGKLSWKEVVAPAVRLADEGFPIDASLAHSLNWIVNSSPEFPELVRVLGKQNGRVDWQAGDTLVQKDLAETLRLIATDGPDAFYKGAIADKLVAEMKQGGGLITKEDLANYHAVARKPIHGTYRGYDVYAPPPPSSGGTCLVEMLNVLETFDLKANERFSAATLHLLAETMRRAYCDRARYLGDPAFTEIPTHLTTKEYARKLAATIDLKQATRSEDLAKDIPISPGEGDSTTHFSIIDQDGMAVANTYTLERSYGSRIMVRGAGFLLNDEMIDFNWKPGITDRAGGIGTKPNQIAPGKRMLSSQTPTVVARDGKVFLITGSPGSRTIINTVLQIIVNIVDYQMNVRAAVDAPRVHHQWFPDQLRSESTAANATALEALRQMGHVVRGTRQGDAHTIWVDPKTGLYHGADDKRVDGKAAGY